MVNEREYVSDSESWEVFVGGITPAEFVSPFEGDLEKALDNLFENWQFEEPAPSWLRGSLQDYAEASFARDLPVPYVGS